MLCRTRCLLFDWSSKGLSQLILKMVDIILYYYWTTSLVLLYFNTISYIYWFIYFCLTKYIRSSTQTKSDHRHNAFLLWHSIVHQRYFLLPISKRELEKLWSYLKLKDIFNSTMGQKTVLEYIWNFYRH